MTIQRLIQAHESDWPGLSSLPPPNSTLGGGEYSERMEPSHLHLPQLDLEMEPEAFMLSLGEEEDTEEDTFD